DEDSWSVIATDKYDGRGELWRYAEQHNENWYNVPMFFGTLEVHNDLQSGRYIAMGLRNEEKRIYEPIKRSPGDYTPNNSRGARQRRNTQWRSRSSAPPATTRPTTCAAPARASEIRVMRKHLGAAAF